MLRLLFLLFAGLVGAVLFVPAEAEDYPTPSFGLPEYRQCVEDTECEVTEESIIVRIPTFWTGLRVRNLVADQIRAYCADGHAGNLFTVHVGKRIVGKGECGDE